MIFALLGPSGSGKTSLEKILEEVYKYKRIISYTTRPPREHEINGIDYHFVTEREFILKNMIESTLYRGWRYGICADDIDYRNHNYILVVEPHGYQQIKDKIGKYIVSIFIKTDDRIRLIRMLQRGDDVDEVIRRFLSDKELFKNFVANHIIENNKYIFDTAEEIKNIIERIDMAEK